MDNTRLISIVSVTALLGAACGGSSGNAPTADTGGTTATVDPGTASVPATAQPTPTEPAATETASTVAATTTEPAPTTTATATPEPEPFDLSALPDLVSTADAALGDASLDPLAAVDALIGFPLPIPVPEGSTLLQFDAILGYVSDSGTTGWNARYDAIAPGGAVDDIDITAEGNGAGSEQLTSFFDPHLTDLGFDRANSTGSDPGDPGGPNSVNHVYVAADPAFPVNGVPATLDPVFIWSSEDINGWAYDDDLAELGGYTVDIGFDTVTADPAAPDAATPFPLANAVMDAVPRPAGTVLSDLSITMRPRSADSFSIDKGTSHIDIALTWDAAPDALDAIIAFYADPAATFPDESVVMAGEPDAFEAGIISRSEPYYFDGTDIRLDLLLLQRYSARLAIDASDDGIEPVRLHVDIELNPADELLALPAD